MEAITAFPISSPILACLLTFSIVFLLSILEKIAIPSVPVPVAISFE